jgi:GTP-binding protein HflX
VFSKADRVFDEAVEKRLKRGYGRSVLVSAHTGAGIDELRLALLHAVEKEMVTRTFTVPLNRMDLVSMLHDSGRVLKEQELNGRRRIKVIGFKPSLARARAAIDLALRS